MTTDPSANKLKIPVTRDDLHAALDMIMGSRILARAFGDCLIQTLYIGKTQDKALQVRWAQYLISCLDHWASGGAA